MHRLIEEASGTGARVPPPPGASHRALRVRCRAGLRPPAQRSGFLATFQEPDLDQYADAYFGLLEDLQALFQRPVDLVVPSAIQNPYFRQAVESTKTLVYAD